MALQGGYGVILKINTGSLTAIVGLLEVKFPKQMKYVAESTGHDATSGYYTAIATGKRRLEAFEAVVAWDDAAATHVQVLTSFGLDTPVNMSIQDPDGQEIIAFAAIVEFIEREGDQEDVYKATIGFHPTGAPTIT